jgi:hypothetical protein
LILLELMAHRTKRIQRRLDQLEREWRLVKLATTGLRFFLLGLLVMGLASPSALQAGTERLALTIPSESVPLTIAEPISSTAESTVAAPELPSFQSVETLHQKALSLGLAGVSDPAPQMSELAVPQLIFTTTPPARTTSCMWIKLRMNLLSFYLHLLRDIYNRYEKTYGELLDLYSRMQAAINEYNHTPDGPLRQLIFATIEMLQAEISRLTPYTAQQLYDRMMALKKHINDLTALFHELKKQGEREGCGITVLTR